MAHPSCSGPGRNSLCVFSYHFSSGCFWPVIPAAQFRVRTEEENIGCHLLVSCLSAQAALWTKRYSARGKKEDQRIEGKKF